MDVKKECMQACRVATFQGREFVSLSFAIAVLVYAPIITLVILAIGSRGFIGYLHGRFLLFAVAPFGYAWIIHAIAKRVASPKQWRLNEFVRLIGSVMVANLLLPLIAILSLIHIAFSGFTSLIMVISGASAVVHTWLYLRQRVLLSSTQTGLAVGVATVAILVLLTILHLILFPNPWEYLLQFVGQGPR